MVHACAGSWLVADQLIASGEFGRIAQLAAEAVAIVKQCR
jgi:2-keto-3-deoxy-6-phosphogluconate aldolase